MKKAVLLFSGGLDSLLALKLLQRQGVEVVPVTMETPFFDSRKAVSGAKELGVQPMVMDILERYLPILRSPKHGYGSQMNPCVDCHILMLKVAKKIMNSLEAQFVATGEVLGQRPMSQTRAALAKIEREAGLDGVLLRPLSARLLSPTLPEEMGWVQREGLMAISGRSRKPQMELARELGVRSYPSPAGGCLLTDPNYARRIKDLLIHVNDITRKDLELLKIGRHFRITNSARLILGRNKEENQVLQMYISDGCASLRSVSGPGPSGLVIGQGDDPVLNVCLEILASYSDPSPKGAQTVEITTQDGVSLREVPIRPKEEFRRFIINP